MGYFTLKVSCETCIHAQYKLCTPHKLFIIDTRFCTSPTNLSFSSSSTHIYSIVTISWVAPLDTPLCVHSYTVTVRNSCNSSQVMVYNTTDNRSSLSITDLTPDGKYSVTVVGRNRAGRLGQESEELIFLIGTYYDRIDYVTCTTCADMLLFHQLVPQIVLIDYDHHPNSVQLKWKVSIRKLSTKVIYNFWAVGKTPVFTCALPDHTQCEFRPVSNNNQQNQCYTVWSATRRDIHCGDHSICTVETRRTKDIYFQ